MPFTLLQGGTALQFMDTSGNLSTLTLPSGVALSSTLVPRFAIFGRYVVVVNSPSRPITVDPDGTVRVLAPRPPRTLIALSGAAGGALSGTYKVKQTFLVKDVDGNLIAESGFGPTSLAATISSQYLRANGLDISQDTISATRLYRNTTNGSVFFPWIDVDGNTQTAINDDLADASLELVAAPTLGAPPNSLELIAAYRSRLWGKTLTDLDTLRFTEASKMYSWPSTFGLTIGRPGSDDRGITGIIARREFLAAGRQDALFQITGTVPTDFRPVTLKENIGIEGPDSIAVFRDIAYFLAKDGVYSWSDEGIRSLSDRSVRSWFTTDTYFNRSRFKNARGTIDALNNKYKLLLANTGSSSEDRWIEYDITDGTWWGPHKTDDFTSVVVGVLLDSDSLFVPVVGSTAGFVYKDQATRTDGTATAIDFDVDTKFHDGNTPDIHKVWLQPALISKIQAAGTLTITPYVGNLDASAGAAISADMTLGRERLRRIGEGRFLKLNLRHNVVGQDVEPYGYELEFFEAGRR